MTLDLATRTAESALQTNAEAPAVTKGTVVMVVGARGIPDVEGGAEKNAEMLFPRLSAAGYDVTLLGLKGLVKPGEYRGVKLVEAPNVRLLKTDKLFYYLFAVGQAIKHRPHIVHLQGLGASLFLLLFKALGARTVVRYGSADYVLDKWGPIGRLGFRAAEFQARFADAVIAVAPALVQRLAGRGITRNVHLIANAVDEPAPDLDIAPPGEGEDGTPFALFVGRVTVQKNVHMIVEGFQDFAERTGKNVRLLIAGGLEDEGYVKELRPRLNDNVVLLGRCNRRQLEGLYKRCAVFVNGSVHEGSSNAVLEAISRNCPIILSDIPENRDFGLDDHIYFNPSDVDSISRGLERAFENPEQHRIDSSRFMSWTTVADKTISVYQSILA